MTSANGLPLKPSSATSAVSFASVCGSGEMAMDVSVIIPTCNRAASLDALLRDLRDQRGGAIFEILASYFATRWREQARPRADRLLPNVG